MDATDLNELHNKEYKKIAAKFASNAKKDPHVVKYLEEMANAAPIGSLLLDVGCGGGQYTDFLNGFRKTIGVDLSPDFIEIARKQYPELEFKEMDMRKLDFPEKSVAGIAAVASLLHIPKKEAPEVLAEFKRVLTTDGKLVLLMKIPDSKYSGDGIESRERSGETISRYFARYTPEELRLLLQEQGFTILKDQRIFFGDSSSPEDWELLMAEVKNG